MDEQLLERLAHEFAGHDDIQALITATRAQAWEARLLEMLTREVTEAKALLEALQIPEGRLAGPEWHCLTLAERIQVLYERMLYHLRQAQAALVAEPARATLTPRTTIGQPVMVQTADAQGATGASRLDELAEVHAVLDAYGVPRVLYSVFGPEWRAQDVRASAAERLRKLHRLMVETGLPDFMPPGMVVDPPEG
jgi:hypothetical protein